MLNVRWARPDDLAAVVDVHMKAFKGFFLTSLGPPFLRQLYAAFMSSGSAIFLVAETTLPGEGTARVAGFVVGTTEPAAFFRKILLSRGIRFVFAALAGLIRHPVIVSRRLFSALFYRGEAPPGMQDAALLSSIGVLPGCSGRGIGKALINAFSEEARSRNSRAVYLLTDEADNESANRFYTAAGFELKDRFRRGNGRVMNRYVRYFSDHEPVG